jgi:hypothetical protein
MGVVPGDGIEFIAIRNAITPDINDMSRPIARSANAGKTAYRGKSLSRGKTPERGNIVLDSFCFFLCFFAQYFLGIRLISLKTVPNRGKILDLFLKICIWIAVLTPPNHDGNHRSFDSSG